MGRRCVDQASGPWKRPQVCRQWKVGRRKGKAPVTRRLRPFHDPPDPYTLPKALPSSQSEFPPPAPGHRSPLAAVHAPARASAPANRQRPERPGNRLPGPPLRPPGPPPPRFCARARGSAEVVQTQYALTFVNAPGRSFRAQLLRAENPRARARAFTGKYPTRPHFVPHRPRHRDAVENTARAGCSRKLRARGPSEGEKHGGAGLQSRTTYTLTYVNVRLSWDWATGKGQEWLSFCRPC